MVGTCLIEMERLCAAAAHFNENLYLAYRTKRVKISPRYHKYRRERFQLQL